MTRFNSIQFQKCFDSLKEHIADTSYEIHYAKKQACEEFLLTPQPNWFFRLVRWLLGKSYKDIPALEKVIGLLQENVDLIRFEPSLLKKNLKEFNLKNVNAFTSIKKGMIARIKNTAAEKKITKLIKDLEVEINKPLVVKVDNKIEERIYHGQMIQKEVGLFDDLGKLNGKGERTFNNGNTETGSFEKGIFKQGTITFFNEQIKKEIGTFDDEKELFGQGQRIFSNGDEEVGEFEKGCLKEGTVTFVQKSVLQEEGKFDDTLNLHGQGMRTFINGDIERGTFDKGDLKEGTVIFGFIGDIDDTIKEETGMFNKEAELDGLDCQRIFRDCVKQDGEFVNGEFKAGKTSYPGGKYLFAEEIGRVDIYGELHGMGERKFFDGTVLEGDFDHGFFAHGNKLFQSGPIVEEYGSFDENLQLDGQGIRHYNENELFQGQQYLIESGKFSKGVLIG